MESVLAAIWAKIAGGFAHIEAPSVGLLELLAVTLVAASVSTIPVTWRFFALFVTLVHEFGHAVAGIMTGRIVTSIKLRFDHSGVTSSYGNLGGPGEVWCTFWGYPVPAVVGGALIWAGLSGWAPAALSIGAIVLLATILVIRNWAGLAVVLSVMAASIALLSLASGEILGFATVFLGIGLLIGSVRDWFKVLSVHTSRRDEIETSDAQILYRFTGIPSPVWLGLFAVPILGSWFIAVTSVHHILSAAPV